jgi:hypothetical protein
MNAEQIDYEYDNTQTALYVQQVMICITEVEETTVRAAYESSHDPTEQADKLNEAAATYLTDVATHRILSEKFWKTETSFPLARAGDVVADFNEKLNKILSAQIAAIANWASAPSVMAGPITGIATDYVLSPISGPLEHMSMAFQATGLAVALLTGQPTLAIPCAKSLGVSAIKLCVEHCIKELISPAPLIDESDKLRRAQALSENGPMMFGDASTLQSIDEIADAIDNPFEFRPGTTTLD